MTILHWHYGYILAAVILAPMLALAVGSLWIMWEYHDNLGRGLNMGWAERKNKRETCPECGFWKREQDELCYDCYCYKEMGEKEGERHEYKS